MERETLRRILHRLIHTFSRPVFVGTENLPKSGGVIVATNHMSRMDTLLLFVNPGRTDITALVADKYQKYPLFKWILDTGGIIWLDRENADFGAIRAAVEALNKGRALGIAPEGTRSRTAQLQEGKPGTALVALRANAPIVPVGISGSEHYFSKALTLRFPRVMLHFGKPFTLAPLSRERRNDQIKEYADEIMCRIAALMPDAYHGYYQGHPRVAQIRAEQGIVVPGI